VLTRRSNDCKLEIAWGYESERYSFPAGHPMNNSRTDSFVKALRKLAKERPRSVRLAKPVAATEEDLLLFHTKEYIEFVREKSEKDSLIMETRPPFQVSTRHRCTPSVQRSLE